MPRSPSLIHNLMPRCLKREEAAAYVAQSVTKFNELVEAGALPKPFRFREEDRFPVWDRAALDAAIESLQGISRKMSDISPPSSDSWADFGNHLKA